MIYFKEQLAAVTMCFVFMFELYLFPMKPEKYLRKPFYSLFKPYLDSVYWVVVYHERLLYTYPFGWLDNRHADWLVLVCDLVRRIRSIGPVDPDPITSRGYLYPSHPLLETTDGDIHLSSRVGWWAQALTKLCCVFYFVCATDA